jgi:hypothetical protein
MQGKDNSTEANSGAVECEDLMVTERQENSSSHTRPTTLRADTRFSSQEHDDTTGRQSLIRDKLVTERSNNLYVGSTVHPTGMHGYSQQFFCQPQYQQQHHPYANSNQQVFQHQILQSPIVSSRIVSSMSIGNEGSTGLVNMSDCISTAFSDSPSNYPPQGLGINQQGVLPTSSPVCLDVSARQILPYSTSYGQLHLPAPVSASATGYLPGHGSSSTLSAIGQPQSGFGHVQGHGQAASVGLVGYTTVAGRDKEKDKDDLSVSTGTGYGYLSYDDRSGRSDVDDLSVVSDRSSRMSVLNMDISRGSALLQQAPLQKQVSLQSEDQQQHYLQNTNRQHTLQLQPQQLRRRQPDRRPHRQSRRYSTTRGPHLHSQSLAEGGGHGQGQWDEASETGSASASVSCSSRSRTHSHTNANPSPSSILSIHYHGTTISQAASQGNLPLCVLLWGMATAKRINLLEPDDQGNTPFHFAALADLPEVMNASCNSSRHRACFYLIHPPTIQLIVELVIKTNDFALPFIIMRYQ